MKKIKQTDTMNLTQAIDHLSKVVESDLQEVARNMEGVQDSSGQAPSGQKSLKRRWAEGNSGERKYSKIKNTFSLVHKYLRHIRDHKEESLGDVEVQKGIHEIMQLTRQAAEKIDTYEKTSSKQKGEPFALSLSQEYQELENFYRLEILRRFESSVKEELAWEEEWGQGDVDVRDIPRLGLRSLEVVKRDRNYELFSLKREDGSPCFNRSMLRHIKMIFDFNQLFSTGGEDPLLQVYKIKDHDAYFSASYIKRHIFARVHDLVDFEKKHPQHTPLLHEMHNVEMSLFMAANPHNIVENRGAKGCLSYFHDFLDYLAKLVDHPEYTALIDASIEADGEDIRGELIQLIHRLCFFLFTRQGSDVDLIRFLYSLMEGEKEGMESMSALSIFHNALSIAEHIDHLLQKHPNGPLMKTLDLFSEKEEEDRGFAPIREKNLPETCFLFSWGKESIPVLRIPSPTRQFTLDDPHLLGEFLGFLRGSSQEYGSEGKVLLFNLQDREAIEETSRSHLLEERQKEAEFAPYLRVITFPRDGAFYWQKEENLDDKKMPFLHSLKEKVLEGFFFPSTIDNKEIETFVGALVDKIFARKGKWSQRECLDGVELMHYFLALKVFDWVKPSLIGIVCKDGLDKSATFLGGIYALVKIVNGIAREESQVWSRRERDHWMWMLMGPTMEIRERVVHFDRLSRTISALSFALEGEFIGKRLKDIESLYSPQFFSTLQAETLQKQTL